MTKDRLIMPALVLALCALFAALIAMTVFAGLDGQRYECPAGMKVVRDNAGQWFCAVLPTVKP